MRFVKDNSLSLAFLGLFIICFIGQIVAGRALIVEDPAGQSQATLLQYIFSADLLKGVFSNWQAALLQLLMLVLLTVFLRQKGASHSRKPEGEAPAKKPHRREWFGKSRSWAYANSLSLALAAMFVLSFIGFFLTEVSVYNAHRMRLGEQPFDLLGFARSADFWFAAFQTWQAEFFAMFAFLIASVFLRQEGSAESKPVDSSDSETGETNE